MQSVDDAFIKLNINIGNNDKKELVEANAAGGKSPIRLSAAYGVITQNTMLYAVRRVVASAGTVRSDFDSPGSRAMKDSTLMLTDILKGFWRIRRGCKLDGILMQARTANYAT